MFVFLFSIPLQKFFTVFPLVCSFQELLKALQDGHDQSVGGTYRPKSTTPTGLSLNKSDGCNKLPG